MPLVVNVTDGHAPIQIQPADQLGDDRFYAFCQANPDLRIERSAEGDIQIMPPTGGETSYRNSDLTTQLRLWAKRDGRGKSFDSNAEFLLPNGAYRSPDASWIRSERLASLTRAQKRRFPPLCPDFVIELTSPSDRLPRSEERRVGKECRL